MEQPGKTVLITGATSGVGKETARQLAAKGMNVIVHGRDQSKIDSTVREIEESTGNKNISSVLADLSSLDSVSRMAQDIIKNNSGLDILINNAGGMFLERGVSADGYEITFAVNYLSHYLLTRLLLPLLEKKAPSRIITLSSVADEAMSKIDIDKVSWPGVYNGFTAYSAAKICETLFAFEMAQRLSGKSIISNAVHPGVVNTGFGSNTKNPVIRGIVKFGLCLIALPPEKGASTSVYLATSADASEITGKYFAKSMPRKPNPFTLGREAQSRLYSVSEELVKKYL